MLDAIGCKRSDGDVVVDVPDVEAAVLGHHAACDLLQPGLILAEHPCDTSDGEDGAGSGHGQAARARACAQFQGNSSSIRLAGWSAIRARTSASQACGSTSLRLAVTMTPYTSPARPPPRSHPPTTHAFRPPPKP